MRDTKPLQKIFDKVSGLEKKMETGFKNINTRFDKTDQRIDKLGLQIARLEDDAPTIEEFEGLDKRVGKLEQHTVTSRS